MKKVLLICGSGASSGFMAAAGRKAAKKAKADLEFKARSDSELDDYLKENDLLLIAPHLKYMLKDAAKEAAPFGVKVAIIPQKVYGSLDGASLVKFAEEELSK
ncbi:PTS sugar transporter subunit IIB [Lacticaseibacillus chiayiensis]|uniref:PTS sugar transporter subunit IIB n=1 Tax=Lacticaseibacillus chiayiensis TaxID=2100821 RepID=UPI0010104B2C|nr:PTS sugar transporter subunit IIB [Lacticaseibacillus chiayiensis]RXT55696.1 PTS sugar transporter subunit IIB [Lacticaseibacillus chiayiensis]